MDNVGLICPINNRVVENIVMTNIADLTVLQNDGFIMRPIQLLDLDTLTAIWGNPEVTRFLPSLSRLFFYLRYCNDYSSVFRSLQLPLIF